MNHFLAPTCALALAAAAAAQSGRSMALTAPVVLGQIAAFTMNHPTAAAGNIYAFLWSPPFAGTAPVVVPGFTVVGDARIDQNNFLAPWTGVLSASGSVTHTLLVPTSASFFGYPFDLQTIDLDASTNTLYLADNDLALVVTNDIGTVEIAAATTTSSTLGDNNLMSIDDSSIGAPVSHGVPTFAYLPIRHRGDEGFVEGYAGTFSATAHNSDIDSVSYRRVGRRLASGSYQVVSCPNGFDVAIVRDAVLRNDA